MLEPTGDPFRDGAEAFERGVPRTDCPYPHGSTEKTLWEDGWDAASAGHGEPKDD